jgi:hypothetical protein
MNKRFYVLVQDKVQVHFMHALNLLELNPPSTRKCPKSDTQQHQGLDNMEPISHFRRQIIVVQAVFTSLAPCNDHLTGVTILMRIPIRSLLPFSFCIFLLTACGAFEFNVESYLISLTPTPTKSQVLPLATPVSQEPAAGICGSFKGEIVTITIRPDIPDPRCAIVTPDQVLKIVNTREESLQVSVANLRTTIRPGDEFTFQIPFEKYLAPGVHFIEALPCCGAAIWLQ